MAVSGADHLSTRDDHGEVNRRNPDGGQPARRNTFRAQYNAPAAVCGSETRLQRFFYRFSLPLWSAFFR
jgi:hypothetical protein